jgi:hydrogenase maturation protease
VVGSQWPVVVIGYGSELRGDDAIGPRVAERVAALALPGVRAIAAPQLAPELAEELAQAGAAIFVDARPAAGDPVVVPQPIAPAAASSALGHTSDPRELLALAQALYGHTPPAWLIAVPAASFELGAPLSAAAESGVAAALDRIAELLTQVRHRNAV